MTDKKTSLYKDDAIEVVYVHSNGTKRPAEYLIYLEYSGDMFNLAPDELDDLLRAFSGMPAGWRRAQSDRRT